MFLDGVPLKVKLVGIAVLALLTFSLVGATLEAVSQVLREEAPSSQLTRDDFTGQLVSQSTSSDDDAVVATLKFICPFH